MGTIMKSACDEFSNEKKSITGQYKHVRQPKNKHVCLYKYKHI